MPDQITLLAPASPRLAVSKKHFRLQNGGIRTESYPNVLRWTHTCVDFADFAEYATTLEAAEAAARFIIIRGRLLPGVDDTQPLMRRLHADKEAGVKATFGEADNRWVLIDFDNFPNPHGTPRNLVEMEALIYAVISDTLPPEFAAAKFWYQWSSSMALDGSWDLLRLHAWFLLDYPQPDSVLTQWAERNGSIDESVYRCVQPNYIAPPEFVGMADPLDGIRSGLCTQWADTDEVAFDFRPLEPDEWVKIKGELAQEQQREWRSLGKDFVYVRPGASLPMLRIAEIGVNSRLHMPITRSAASWVTCCGVNPDRQAWKQLVRERIALCDHPDAAHRASDRYLDAQWRSAVNKFKSLKPEAPPVPIELIINNNVFAQPKG